MGVGEGGGGDEKVAGAQGVENDRRSHTYNTAKHRISIVTQACSGSRSDENWFEA
jgi:hypothetical protein